MTDPVFPKIPTAAEMENASTTAMLKMQALISKELELRKVIEGAPIYTFVKKKEGKLLNRDNKYVGGKVCALYEFKTPDKKTKDFMIRTECRGQKEPIEDTVSKYMDQSKYRLVFDDDDAIIGCYQE